MRFSSIALLLVMMLGISRGEEPPLFRFDTSRGEKPLLFRFDTSRGEKPLLFRQRTFNAVDLAEAVNHFVALGEADAVRELTALAVENDPSQSGVGKDSHLPERIGWVCRILFVSKDGQPLPPPGLGGLHLPVKTMPLADWPLYPVAASGKSYFVLSEGYMCFGLPEPAEWYIASCRRAGVFRIQPVPVPTGAEARRDAEALLNSVAWKAIRWKEKGGRFNYSAVEQWTLKFIQSQADTIE